jgi:hypothetical protein
MKKILSRVVLSAVIGTPVFTFAQAQVQWCVVNNNGGTVVPGFCFTSQSVCMSNKNDYQSCVAMPKTN